MRVRNNVVKASYTTESMFSRCGHMGFQMVGLRIVRNGRYNKVAVVVVA